MKQQHATLAFITCVILVAACKIYYTPRQINYKATANAAQVKEGKRLAMMICAGCHYNPDTKQLTGHRIEDIPGIVGKVYSRNLTHDPDKGIGHYTDGELVYLIRTGISKSGKLMPYMQRPNLATEDMEAIIAFLRSDDELVRASTIEPPASKYTPIGKLGLSKYMKPLAYSEKTIKRPDLGSDKVAYGRYLVDNLACFHCHSGSFRKLNMEAPEKSKAFMGGGNKMKGADGIKIEVPNVTFHETGIGNWNEQDLTHALKDGIAKGGSELRPPMPKFKDLSDAEAAAIYAYLKTIPKINHPYK
jgi:mono/diheme cytochrome c family protein